MQHKLLQIIQKPAFKIGFSLFVLLLIFFFLPIDELWDSFRRISVEIWFFVIAAYFGLHFVSAIKWQVLVNTGSNKIRLWQAVRFYSAGLFSNLFLPSLVGGDVIKAGLAIHYTSEKGATIVGTMLDRLIDTGVIVLIIIVAGFLAPDFLNRSDQRIVYTITILLFTAMLVSVVLVMIPIQKWNRKPYAPFFLKVRKAILRAMSRPFRSLTAFILSSFVQSGLILLSIVLAHGIGIQLPVLLWFLILPLTKLSTLLPISLGGMGVREVVLAILLSRVDVVATQAVALGLLWETVIIVGGLSCGVIYFLSNRFSGDKMLTIRQASMAANNVEHTD